MYLIYTPNNDHKKSARTLVGPWSWKTSVARRRSADVTQRGPERKTFGGVGGVAVPPLDPKIWSDLCDLTDSN